MDGWILDKDYNTIGVLDNFDSFIWTDRYLGYGDFEIYMPAQELFLNPIRQDNYIASKTSDRYMIAEQIEIATNVETGAKAIVTGRSLESILERRIIWGRKVLTGNFQEGIKTLLTESIIDPIIPARKIPNFIFKPSTDPTITSLEINIEFIGDNLYDSIFVLCETENLGFRVLPSGSGVFTFELYRGIDRSYDQTEKPYVIFSPKFENLLSSNYLETNRNLRNAALVAGEGEGIEQILVEAISNNNLGLDRREMYIEAKDVSSSTDDVELTESEYKNILIEKGLQELSKTYAVQTFEGEIDASRQFVYGTDFFIGDIVQVVNEYDMEARSRITELIQTHNAEGISYIPSFTTI